MFFCKPGLLIQLLSLKWTEPRFVVILEHYLNVLYPFLAHFPASVAMVVSKLFEVVLSINVDCHVSSVLSLFVFWLDLKFQTSVN
jgi:hypothetical protein